MHGAGVIHLEPGSYTYQAIDLADEGAYVREERVFAFEEAVAFENARLTGPGKFGVDVVHLKGQGKVLLRLDGALKAMAIPPGTPLKVPLARLVGWYGYVSVRVMGFVGQGAVGRVRHGRSLRRPAEVRPAGFPGSSGRAGWQRRVGGRRRSRGGPKGARSPGPGRPWRRGRWLRSTASL